MKDSNKSLPLLSEAIVEVRDVPLMGVLRMPYLEALEFLKQRGMGILYLPPGEYLVDAAPWCSHSGSDDSELEEESLD